jgi:hypothetical protein
MSPEIAPDLLRRLKRLRLGGLVPTLPDRAAHARQAKLSPLEFLELLLQDEIDRRDSQGLTLRVQAAGFDEIVTYDELVWETPVHYDRTRVRELFRLDWLAAQETSFFVVRSESARVGSPKLAKRLPGRAPGPLHQGPQAPAGPAAGPRRPFRRARAAHVARPGSPHP